MKHYLKLSPAFAMAVGAVLFFNLPFASAKIEIIDTEVTGVINQTGSVGDVEGNRNFSFVDEGAHYNTDVITRAKKDLKHGWKWDLDTRVRKTDDKEVDQRTSVHLLQLTTRVMNKDNKFTFGDYYTRFTDLTLNRSLEGFNYQADFKKVGTKINAVAGQQFRGLSSIRNARYVWGYDINQSLVSKKTFIINDWKMGTTLADTFDSDWGIDQSAALPKMKNLLGSIYTNIRAIEDLNVNVELAKSKSSDDNGIFLGGDTYGYAFRLRSDYRKRTKLGDTYLNFDYERIEPGYLALTGSAVPDREAYYAGFNQRFNPQLTFNAQLRTLRDNLKKGPLPATARTVNPRFDLYITPIKEVPDFQVIPYVDYRKVHNSNSTVLNNTTLTGVEARKKLWYGYNVMFAYDLRRRIDDVGTSDESDNEFRFGVNNTFDIGEMHLAPYFNFHIRNDQLEDVYNRLTLNSFNWGLTAEFFKKFRVYFTYGLNYDDRTFQNTDTDYYAWDVTAEYDLTSRLMFVIGWRQYNQHFQVRSNDFEENVGSIRLQYKY